jgi:hypothetical protein
MSINNKEFNGELPFDSYQLSFGKMVLGLRSLSLDAPIHFQSGANTKTEDLTPKTIFPNDN